MDNRNIFTSKVYSLCSFRIQRGLKRVRLDFDKKTDGKVAFAPYLLPSTANPATVNFKPGTAPQYTLNGEEPKLKCSISVNRADITAATDTKEDAVEKWARNAMENLCAARGRSYVYENGMLYVDGVGCRITESHGKEIDK